MLLRPASTAFIESLQAERWFQDDWLSGLLPGENLRAATFQLFALSIVCSGTPGGTEFECSSATCQI